MSRFLMPSSSVAEEEKPISRFLLPKEEKPKDVFDEAEADPAVQSWFKELKSKHPDIEAETAAEFMRKPQGLEGYNYEAALKAGVKPKLDPESGELHWGSADPQSGQILKGILHPTYGKELAAQQAQDASKIEEQALGLPKEVEQRKDFDRSLATLNLERLAQEALKANEQASMVSPPKIAGDAARQALRGIIPAISPISPTVIPKSERELAASREFAPYAADTAILAALAAHGNIPAIISYGAFRASGEAMDLLPKISETKAGLKATGLTGGKLDISKLDDAARAMGLAVPEGMIPKEISTKMAMDLVQEGTKLAIAAKAGQIASGKFVELQKYLKGVQHIKAKEVIKQAILDEWARLNPPNAQAGTAIGEYLPKRIEDAANKIYEKMSKPFTINGKTYPAFTLPKEMYDEVMRQSIKQYGSDLMTNIQKFLPKMGRTTLLSGIPIPEELPKLRDILGAFKISPEVMAQVEAGQMAALPAEALAAVKQQMPHLFQQAPQHPVSGETAPPFPEKRQSGEPVDISKKIGFDKTFAWENMQGKGFEVGVAQDYEAINDENIALPKKQLAEAWKERLTKYGQENRIPEITKDGDFILFRGSSTPKMKEYSYLTPDAKEAARYGEVHKQIVHPADVSYSSEEGNFIFEPRAKTQVPQIEQPEGEIDINEVIKKNISAKEIEQMAERFVKMTEAFSDYYPESKTAQEWLKNEDAGQIAMELESDSELYRRYFERFSGYEYPNEIMPVDIIKAYQQGILQPDIAKEKLDLAPKIEDLPAKPRDDFWSPKRISLKDSKGTYEIASQRVTKSNSADVLAARKNIFLAYNIDPALHEKIGITKAELNKKIRSFSGYSVKAAETQQRINAGIPEDYQWRGISNLAWINKQSISPKDVDAFVKDVVVKDSASGWVTDKGEWIRRYVIETLLGIDTRLLFKDLTIRVESMADYNKRKGGGSNAVGLYDNDTISIIIDKQSQNTVAHEIGHYLDYKFAREIGLSSDALSRSTPNWPHLKEKYNLSEEHIEWAKKFQKFVMEVSERSDLRSAYTQDRAETFARLVARFVDWSGKQANVYTFQEMTHYKDLFTQADYEGLAHLLQQKAYIDEKFGIKSKVLKGEGGMAEPSKEPRKGHRTLSGYIISRGGIDPKKFEAAGYKRKDLSEFGMGHLLRRGGQPFDVLADELANGGLIQVPFDRNNTDVLLEAIQGKAAYAFGDGDPTRKELEAQAKHWADQERIEKQQRDIDKKLGIDFDVEEIEAEVEKELIKQMNDAQKAAGKPSILNIRDVKKVIRENAGITKVSNLIKEEEALERSLQRQAAAAKKAYAEGKKDEALKLRQKWLEDKAKKKLAEMTKQYIKDIHAIDTSKMSKINKENIEAIQELVDVAVPTEKTMASLRGTLEYMKDNPEADLPDYVIEDLKRLEMLNRSNMTFDQLESLRTAVKHYAALEKLKQKIRVGRQDRQFEAVKESSISEMKDPKEVQSQIIESTDEAKLKAKKVGQNLADVFGINQDHYDLIIESIAKGGEDSETFNILFQQVKDGIRKELETKHNYVDLFRMEQKLRGLDKSVKNMAKWRKEKVRIGNFNLTRGQRVALLCHVRNEKNLTHILEGGFAFKEDPYSIHKISEEQLDDLLQSMTPEEKAYAEIQTIMSDAIYEDLNAVFQRKNGYDLPKEENYYRIKVARSELGKEQQEESILDDLKNRYVRIGLSKGFLNKRRAGAKQALILDDFFRDLNDHIHTASAYVGLEEPLSNASKLLYDKGWRTEFNRRYGDNVWKQIEKGLRDIAGDFESYSDTENFFNYLKSAATKAIFSMNPSTIAKQVLSWPLAQLYVENKHLFQGLADYLTDREGVINRHKMFSPEFRERIETGGYERDVSDIFRHKATGRLAGEKEDLSDFLLAGNRWMDKQTVAAVMQGCVLQKLEELEGSGLSPEEKLKQAYEFADYVVNRTLSTSAVEHRSAMSRGSVIDRMMTFATTDTNQQLNMIRRFWRNYQRTKDPKERSKAFKSLMLILAHAGITIPLGNAMIDWTMDTLYRRKEKPKFSAKFFAKNMISQTAGLMYIVRDVVSSLVNKADKGTFAGQDITYPSFQILNNVADSAANLYRGMTMHKEKDLIKGVDGLAEILFMLRGLPYRTPKKMITSVVGEITGQPRRSEGQKKSKGGSRFLSGGGGGGSSSGSGGSRFLR